MAMILDLNLNVYNICVIRNAETHAAGGSQAKLEYSEQMFDSQ